MHQFSRLIYLPSMCLGIALFATIGHAGSGNSIIIEQISDGSGIGNTLIVDQTAAEGSNVGGVSDSYEFTFTSVFEEDAVTALRNGLVSRSSVTLDQNTISIDGGASPAIQNGSDNEVSIEVIGSGGYVGMQQFGTGNTAEILVNGTGARGIIIQNGHGNFGKLEVMGEYADGEIFQIGNKNDTNLNVSGENARVSYTINGNDVVTKIPASVVTNVNGQVTIVQSQFNSFSE